jgi:hypothetical protein
MFTLATSFQLPPKAIETLTISTNLYKQALTLTNSPLLHMDAGYNLAQALSDLAEIVEDIEPSGNGDDRARELRTEARGILESVFEGQGEYLRLTSESHDEASVEEQVEEVEAGAEGEGMEVDKTDEGETDDTYETHLPTPSTLIDTTLLLLDIHLSLWSTLTPAETPTSDQQVVVRSILDCAAVHVPPGRTAELDLAEIKVLLTMDQIVWDMFCGEARIGTGVEKSLEGAIAALGALLSSLDQVPPDEPTLRAEMLTTLAETHMTTASRLLFLTPQLPPGASPLAQGAWYHLSQAVTHLNKALELGTPAGSPKSFGPSVLLNLSKASLRRARLGEVNETAKKNGKQLVENAINYANRALLGLSWDFAKVDVKALDVKTGPAQLPWEAGWDTEVLARSGVLQLLRVCWYTQKIGLESQEGDKYANAGKSLVARIKTTQGDRGIRSGDVERWVQEVEDEEQGVSEEEKTWWRSVATELGQ